MVRSRRFRVVFVSVFGAAFALAACSHDISKPGFAGDGVPSTPSPTSGGGADGGDGGDGGREAGDADDSGDAGACGSLTLTGLLVDRIGVVGDPPVSSGGTVADGSYDLTSYVVYVGAGGVAGPTGLTARSTIRIAAGKIEQVLEIGGSSALKTVRSISAYNATAATFATTELCPNVGGGAQRQFTANAPTLVLTDLTTKEAFTFAKR